MGYCGWERCAPGHRYGPNRRESYVIHVILGGQGTLETDGKVYHLGTGDVFLLYPGIEAWYQADNENPWEYLWMGFQGYKAEKIMERAGFEKNTPVHHVDCGKLLKKYIDIILESHELSMEEEIRRNGCVRLFMAELMASNERLYPEILQDHSYPGSVYVEHAIEYMTHHYREKIRINELADYIGVNRSYLTDMFKKTINCSPKEYLVNLRMEEAKNLLHNTQKQINEIAEEVGYTDQLAFSKIFKQHCGMSPREYREQKAKVVFHKEKGAYHGRI